MLILGLDPGSRHTGYGLVDHRGDRLRALDLGVISCRARDPLPARLAFLAATLGELIERRTPDAVALETPFHGLNARSLIVLAQARGALVATAAGRGLEVREYAPSEVKAAVTGHGRAGKDQVARMVRMILSLDGPPVRDDATDALAVAICCAHRRPLERLEAGAGA